MSKKRLGPTEARWRANYRYRRMRRTWLVEEAMGDPLGLAAVLRKEGLMVKMAAAILATAPLMSRPQEGATGR
jgi:hypothetical protein